MLGAVLAVQLSPNMLHRLNSRLSSVYFGEIQYRICNLSRRCYDAGRGLFIMTGMPVESNGCRKENAAGVEPCAWSKSM